MTTQTPRRACIFVTAPKGDVRAAASLIRRALRAVGVTVHRGHYISQVEAEGDARFSLDITDAQATAFSTEVERLSIAEGWSRPPLDFYHD